VPGGIQPKRLHEQPRDGNEPLELPLRSKIAVGRRALVMPADWIGINVKIVMSDPVSTVSTWAPVTLCS
jgi:hypothetical protein